MRIFHLSYAHSGGGAAEAAYRLHSELGKRGVDTKFRCLGNKIDSLGNKQSINRLPYLATWCNLAKHYSARIIQLGQKDNNSHWHSISYFPSWLDVELNKSPASVLHLHWIQSEFISVEAIGRLNKQIVWTLHDSWPFCGSEHHPRDSKDTRFISGYISETRSKDAFGLDLDKWCWQRKLKSWDLEKFTFIAPSTWSKEQALQSRLLKNCDVEVIPNIVDDQFFSCKLNKTKARSELGISDDRIILTVGASFLISDANKGAGVINSLINELVKEDPMVILILFGTSEAEKRRILKIYGDVSSNILILPFLDKNSLSRVFFASNLVIVPSRIESFGLIAAEAQATGVPVIAYKTSGLTDVIVDGTTGRLVPAFNERLLIKEIKMMTQKPDVLKRMGQAARKNAVMRFSSDEVIQKHVKVYSSLGLKGNRVIDPNKLP